LEGAGMRGIFHYSYFWAEKFLADPPERLIMPVSLETALGGAALPPTFRFFFGGAQRSKLAGG